MEVNFNITLTPKQQEAWDNLHSDDCNVLVAKYSRQCGKTILAEVMMIEYLLKPNTFNAYISPSFAQGRKVYQELIQLLDKTGIIKKANASELQITSTSNATLKFFSMESPTAIRGNTISGLLVLDEAAFFPTVLSSGEDPWFNVILPTIKARKPKVLVISTPNGKQGMFFDLYTKAVAGTKGYKALSATIYDDQLVTPEEIEELKQGYPPLAWRQEFEVEFLDDALTVFPGFDKCFNREYTKTNKCWIGIDPSSVGEDNTIVTIVNEVNEVKQYKIEGSLDSKYKQIADLINQYNPVMAYMESNSIGEVMANEVQKMLKNKSRFKTFNTNNESKKDYISLIAVAIANKDIAFEPCNKLLYSEMATFTYKLSKTGKLTFAAKDGYHDDTVTSLGIALQCKEDHKLTGNNITFVKTTFNRRYI